MLSADLQLYTFAFHQFVAEMFTVCWNAHKKQSACTGGLDRLVFWFWI